MDRIWAPWRIEYIRGPKEDGCFLCDIIRSQQDRENLVIQRGQHGLLLLNRYPYNGGHLMACPYRHIATLQELNDAELGELLELTRLATRLLDKVARPQGYNIGINQGEAAGAGLRDHIHLHIVPRWHGDTNFMPVFAEVRVVPQALEALRDELAAAL